MEVLFLIFIRRNQWILIWDSGLGLLSVCDIRTSPSCRFGLIVLYARFLFWKTFGFLVGEDSIYNLLFIKLLIVSWTSESENFKIKTAKTLARKREKAYLCLCSGVLFAGRPTG